MGLDHGSGSTISLDAALDNNYTHRWCVDIAALSVLNAAIIIDTPTVCITRTPMKRCIHPWPLQLNCTGALHSIFLRFLCMQRIHFPNHTFSLKHKQKNDVLQAAEHILWISSYLEMVGLLLQFMLVQIVACRISEQADTRYVRPTGSPLSICPNHPCLTLQQYSKITNFTTGTEMMTLLFLSGNHSLPQATLNLTSVSNITLRGEQVANVVCTNEITIQLENVTFLRIEGLKFILNYTGTQRYGISALNLINCNDVFVYNATFQGSGMATLTAMSLEHSKSTITGCGFEGIVGGAIHAKQGTNLTICGCSFTSNKGTGAGGAISAATNSAVVLDGSIPNIFNHNTDRYSGGAMKCIHCTLKVSGNNTFWNNSAMDPPSSGGALHVDNGRLIISGTTFISNSTAESGGAIYMQYSHAIFNGTSLVFQGNTAKLDGGGMWIQNTSVITLTRSLMFIGNVAEGPGGAIRIDNFEKHADEVILSGDFVNNTAGDNGGAVAADSAYVTFVHSNLVANSQNALSVSRSNITFNGITRIVSNTGGAIEAEHSSLTFEDHTTFDSNSSPNGGALNCYQGAVSFRGLTLFMGNKADDNGGAIYAFGTSIHIQDHVNFTSNTASENGGAMYLDTGATLTLKSFRRPTTERTQLSTSDNFAQQYGGGIYRVDSPTTHQCSLLQGLESFKRMPYCFLQVEALGYNDLISIAITSHNDSAGIEGNFLYGGLLNRCRLQLGIELTPGAEIFINGYYVNGGLISITSLANEKREITSEAYDLCFCSNNETTHLICRNSFSIEVHRGQMFVVPLLAIAQVGTTATTVTAITSSKAKLEVYQTSQLLPDYCYALPYTLYSIDSYEEVVLYPNGPCRDRGLAKVSIIATLLPCPNGFTQYAEICACEVRLHHHDINCTIANIPYMTKAAGSKFWMGVLYTNTTYEGLILATLCPVEYCKTGTVNITLDNPDIQCDFHRSGLLCGACAANYSLMLGSSQCQVCPNTYLALLLPFTAAGIALVVFLTFLGLTVATGSLNSVILYANIVQVNRKLFFPVNTRNVLTVFIAWMNLDLGFQTCFYDGLDAYTQTWLQFAFPLYVWLLVVMVIFISRYSIMVSKLIGHNPIAVLATLLLMSYTKVLKIIIEVYSSVKLDYPGNVTVTVWLKDANVPYLQSNHLLLTVVTSLVLVFFFLPYTILLLLGHKLYRLSGRKYFRWLKNVKPLLDSYYAPYKTNTRYWTGFLLLVRCALYIVFLLDSLSANKSFLAITLTFTVLGFTMGIVYAGRIYRKFYINLIEAGTYLNLIILSTTTGLTGISSGALVYSLVALSFITMVIICAYQFHLRYMSKTALWRRLEGMWLHCRSKLHTTNGDSDTPPPAINTSHDPHKIVTRTVIELREPLIES